jgi:hypothetical protein
VSLHYLHPAETILCQHCINDLFTSLTASGWRNMGLLPSKSKNTLQHKHFSNIHSLIFEQTKGNKTAVEPNYCHFTTELWAQLCQAFIRTLPLKFILPLYSNMETTNNHRLGCVIYNIYEKQNTGQNIIKYDTSGSNILCIASTQVSQKVSVMIYFKTVCVGCTAYFEHR